MPLRWFSVPIATFALFSTACRDSKIATYRIPKENDSPAPASPSTATPAGMPGFQNPGAITGAGIDGDGLAWTAPADWKPKVASAMRKASYTVGEEGTSGGDFAITAFPGDVGGDLANVNRWRGQLQLPPIIEAELASAITLVEVGGLTMHVVDLVGTAAEKPQRLLGAIVPHGGATWFFKLTGPEALVARKKPAYLEFLRTVKPASDPSPASSVPASAGTAASAPEQADHLGLKWTAPAHWVSKPASAMRRATYAVSGENGASADFSVTAFPGAVGGELANINRWRGQLALPPLTESELPAATEHLTVNGLSVMLVELTGGPADKPQGMLGAIVPSDGSNWFFKLTGPAALVAKEKPSFLSLIQSLKAP